MVEDCQLFPSKEYSYNGPKGFVILICPKLPGAHVAGNIFELRGTSAQYDLIYLFRAVLIVEFYNISNFNDKIIHHANQSVFNI